MADKQSEKLSFTPIKELIKFWSSQACTWFVKQDNQVNIAFSKHETSHMENEFRRDWIDCEQIRLNKQTSKNTNKVNKQNVMLEFRMFQILE